MRFFFANMDSFNHQPDHYLVDKCLQMKPKTPSNALQCIVIYLQRCQELTDYDSDLSSNNSQALLYLVH